jgi:hypothetical protein
VWLVTNNDYTDNGATDMTKLTATTILKTRQWFVENQQACIDGALNGTLGLASHVDITAYAKQCRQYQFAIIRGEWDHTFTFQQRAVYIQTGECHALLP